MTKSIQIVFLIDVNNIFLSAKIGFDDPIKAVRLTCLKILTYFSNNECRGKENVKWGYKFFDSLNCQSVNQKCDFTEFKLDVFEEFENELTIRTEKQYLLVQKYEQLKEGRHFKSGSEKTVFPSDSVNTALKDILCDFQWDRPDIISPIRSKRRNRSKPTYADPITNKRNFVFLITKSPVSRDDLASYFGVDISKNVDLSSFLLGRLMSETVLNNYINIAKVNLFWIDTCSLETSWATKRNFDGYIALEAVLKRLNWNLIPMTCLVQSEMWSSSLISNGILQSILPSASILQWYLSFSSDEKHSVYTLRLNTTCTFDVQLIPFEMKKKSHYPVKDAGKIIDVIGMMSSKQINCQPLASFTCIAQHPSVFPKLLLHLVKTKQNLVIKMDSLIGLLLPMTLGTATLLMIVPDVDNSPFESSNTGKSTSIFLDDFIINDTNKYIDEVVQNKIQEIKSDPALNTLKSNCKHHRFSTNMLERWYTSSFRDLSSTQKIKQRQQKYYEEETNILKKLQQLYKPALPLSVEKLSTKPEACTRDNHQTKSSNLNVSQRVSNLVSQSQLLTTQNKEEEIKKENFYHQLEIDEQNCRSRQKQMRLQTIEKQTTEMGDEKELLEILSKHYEEAVDSGCNLLTCAESIVNTTLFHCKAFYVSDSQEEAKRILDANFFKATTIISELYQKADATLEAKRINEYKLQVLLQLESFAVIPDVFNQDKCVDEVTAHLRCLSLYTNPLTVKEFLGDVILDNYRFTLKEALQEIYEELDQPLPALLASIKFSDSDSVNTYSSDLSQIDSYPLSSESQSKIALSARNRILSRQASFHENNSKRQITVPVLPKFQDKNQLGIQKQSEKLESKKCNEAKRVRRNLFESQGSVDNQTMHKHRRKELVRTPKGQHVLKTRAVNETPVHKQVANPLLARQEHFFRRKPTISIDSCVIEESPERGLRRSPHQHSSRMKGHHSFYSSSAKSRNLEKASSLMEGQDEPIIKSHLFQIDNIHLPTDAVLQMTPVKSTDLQISSLLPSCSEPFDDNKNNDIPLKFSMKKCFSEEISDSRPNKGTPKSISKSHDCLSPTIKVNRNEVQHTFKKSPVFTEIEKSPVLRNHRLNKLNLNIEGMISLPDKETDQQSNNNNPDWEKDEKNDLIMDDSESSLIKTNSKDCDSSPDISSGDSGINLQNLVSEGNVNGKLVKNNNLLGSSGKNICSRRLDFKQHVPVEELNEAKKSKQESLMNESNLPSTEVGIKCIDKASSSEITSQKKSKKNPQSSEIYSQHFTRRSSKVMNLSLETFNQLSIMSPQKESPKHKTCSTKRQHSSDFSTISKKQCVSYSSGSSDNDENLSIKQKNSVTVSKKQCVKNPYVSLVNFLDNTVENICQGYNFYISPQKAEISIHTTPHRSQKYTSPSALSLLHLTTSPLIKKSSNSVHGSMENDH